MNYPLAKHDIFSTIQGEGVLMGEPMVFIRLAGCNVGCAECDTDYAVHHRMSAHEIARRAVEVQGSAKWVWVTGGEPTIHDLVPLITELRRYGFRLALATAGVADVPRGNSPPCGFNGFDFVSVSPHRVDESWVLRRGDQLNFVPGLNGLASDAMDGVDVSGFSHKFITPLAGTVGVDRYVAWLTDHPGWRLGCQSHKVWGLA